MTPKGVEVKTSFGGFLMASFSGRGPFQDLEPPQPGLGGMLYLLGPVYMEGTCGVSVARLEDLPGPYIHLKVQS